MTMNNEIHDAFESIILSDKTKEKIFYQIQRNFDKKGYISGRKLHFFKQTFDRFVPAIALCIVIFVGFSFYGVTTGLFTGVPYKTTEEILQNTGNRPAPLEIDTPEPAARNAASGSSAPATAGTVTANIYAAIDIGYTHYIVQNIPQDPIVLWDEIITLGAVPEAISLDSYSMDSSQLVLNFNKELQTIQDSSATTSIVCGIAKTYDEFYPESESLIINSDGAALSFQGATVDINTLIAQNINITDTKNVVYEQP